MYKRFDSVTAVDRTWSFAFRRPSVRPSNTSASASAGANNPEFAHTSAWMLLPAWSTGQHIESPFDRGCSFLLERPKDGTTSFKKDLLQLPRSTLPIIGHTAIIKSKDTAAPFERFELECLHRYEVSLGVSVDASADGSIQEVVVANNSQGTRLKYLLFCHRYTPDANAVRAYEEHTKRKLPKSKRAEEITLYFSLNESGRTDARPSQGQLHAVLPTKIGSGSTAHVQAGWLLSVDRQSLQSLQENAWNACCLRQYPALFLLVMRWVAITACKQDRWSEEIVRTGYSMLPSELQHDGAGRLCWHAFDSVLDLSMLATCIQEEKIVPVWKTCDKAADGAVCFERNRQVLRLPPSFLKRVPTSFLQTWTGGRRSILATHLLGAGAVSRLWDCVAPPSQSQFRDMATGSKAVIAAMRKTEGDEAVIRLAIDLLAALAEHVQALNKAASEDGPAPGQPAKPSGGSQAAALAMDAWPVFLTQDWTLVPAKNVIWVEKSFNDVPSEIASILREHAYVPPPTQQKKQANDGRRKKREQRSIQQIQHSLLNGVLFKRLYETAGRTSESVYLCRKLIDQKITGATAAGNVATVDQLVRNYFTAVSRLREPLGSALVADVAAVTKLGFLKSTPSMITHVLVKGRKRGSADAGPDPPMLLEACKGALGAAYGFNLLEEVAGEAFRFVDPLYLGGDASPSTTKRWACFFEDCGVCGAKISFVEKDEGLPTDQDKRCFQGGALPAKRTSNKEVPLPYNLEGKLTKKRHQIIDVFLSPTWSKLLQQDMSLTQARAFAILLSRTPLDAEEHVTAGNCAALSPAIKGHDHARGRLSVWKTSSRRRCLWLPPGQPGCHVQDCGPAHWVRFLRALPWIPVTNGGLVTPDRAVFHENPDRPDLLKVDLPSSTIRTIHETGLDSTLGFGTAKPPSPVEHLESLAHERDVSFSRLSMAWVEVLKLARDNNLKGNDRYRIEKVAKAKGVPGSSRGFTPSQCVPLDRLFDSSRGEERTESLNSKANHLWATCGWLVDVSDSAFELHRYKKEFSEVLRIPSRPSRESSIMFLEWAVGCSLPRLTMNDAFTLAMHAQLSHNGESVWPRHVFSICPLVCLLNAAHLRSLLCVGGCLACAFVCLTPLHHLVLFRGADTRGVQGPQFHCNQASFFERWMGCADCHSQPRTQRECPAVMPATRHKCTRTCTETVLP